MNIMTQCDTSIISQHIQKKRKEHPDHFGSWQACHWDSERVPPEKENAFWCPTHIRTSSERGMWRKAQGMGGVGQQASVEVTSWSAARLPPHSVPPAPELGHVQGGCPAVLAGLTGALPWQMPADLLPPSFTPAYRFPPPPWCSHLPMCSQFHQLPCPSLFLSSPSLFFPLYPKGYYTFRFPNSCPFAWQPSGRDSFFLVMLLSLRAFSRAAETLELYARFCEDALFKGNSLSSSPVLEDFTSSLSWRCPPSQMICGAPFHLLLGYQGTSLYTGRCSALYSLHSGRTGDLHQTSIKGLNYSPIIH